MIKQDVAVTTLLADWTGRPCSLPKRMVAIWLYVDYMYLYALIVHDAYSTPKIDENIKAYGRNGFQCSGYKQRVLTDWHSTKEPG